MISSWLFGEHSQWKVAQSTGIYTMSGQPLHWLAVATNLCILPREMAETAQRNSPILGFADCEMKQYGRTEFECDKPTRSA